jgi:hypothetical protein
MRLEGALVGDEAALRDEPLVVLRHEGLHHELDELVGATAEHHLLLRDAVELRESLLQAAACGIGIAVQVLRRVAQRRDGGGRRAERVLVGGELDGIPDAELPLHVLDGLARLIGRELLDVASDQRHGALEATHRFG